MSYQNAKLMNLEDGQKLLEAIDQHKAEIGTVTKNWEDHKTEAFAVGEYVIKDNVTYRFKAAHAANTAWNASEVEATNLGTEITGLKSAILLQEETIPDTTQTISFDSSGNVSSIVHKDGSNNTIRSDAFTFGTNTITEVRTLYTGETLTIVTNTTTLVTTVTYAAA